MAATLATDGAFGVGVTVDPDSVGSQRAPRSMWYKFGALALVYLGLWLLVELAGRIYIAVDGMPLTSTLATYQNDDVLGYRPNPGFKLDDLRFNRQGFRGDIEYSDHPTPGVTRILAVGGSTTFGTGGATADAYPHRLQEDLRAQCTPVEVINAGVSGCSGRTCIKYSIFSGGRINFIASCGAVI